MCRNIKTLANFEPPATGDEIRASALQFVRKLSGMNKPSRANEAAFNRAVDEVTDAARAVDCFDLDKRAAAQSRGRSAQSAGARARAIRLTVCLIAIFPSGPGSTNCSSRRQDLLRAIASGDVERGGRP